MDMIKGNTVTHNIKKILELLLVRKVALQTQAAQTVRTSQEDHSAGAPPGFTRMAETNVCHNHLHI